MAEKEAVAGKGKKKGKKVKKESDIDVDAEMEQAMQEVADAMKQVRLAEKQAKAARKDAKEQKKQMPGKNMGGGIELVHQNPRSKSTTLINIQSANNIQVGSHNTMVVYKDSKPRKSRHVSEKSSSSEEEEDEEEDVEEEKDPQNMTEEERKIHDVLYCEKVAEREDIKVVLGAVGKEWRRFLRYLDITDTDIERLELEFTGQGGVREVLYQGILKWKKTNSSATVGKLAQSLKKLGAMDAVKVLSDRNT